MPQTIEQQITEQWRQVVEAELSHDKATAVKCKRRIDELLDLLPVMRPAAD